MPIPLIPVYLYTHASTACLFILCSKTFERLNAVFVLLSCILFPSFAVVVVRWNTFVCCFYYFDRPFMDIFVGPSFQLYRPDPTSSRPLKGIEYRSFLLVTFTLISARIMPIVKLNTALYEYFYLPCSFFVLQYHSKRGTAVDGEDLFTDPCVCFVFRLLATYALLKACVPFAIQAFQAGVSDQVNVTCCFIIADTCTSQFQCRSQN